MISPEQGGVFDPFQAEMLSPHQFTGIHFVKPEQVAFVEQAINHPEVRACGIVVECMGSTEVADDMAAIVGWQRFISEREAKCDYKYLLGAPPEDQTAMIQSRIDKDAENITHEIAVGRTVAYRYLTQRYSRQFHTFLRVVGRLTEQSRPLEERLGQFRGKQRPAGEIIINLPSF